jgi:hypothetical protein
MADESRIRTPEKKLRTLQRTLYRQAKGRLDSEPMNHIGKPDAGDPHVRFDEGGWTSKVQSLLYYNSTPNRFSSSAMPA